MASQEQLQISSQPSEVSKFYEGKSLFITGAAGFVGSVLLEALLRCCPGIRQIYILLRPKKGVSPEDRKEKIFKKEIFFHLREKNPDVVNKVVVIPGDVAHSDLGMSSDDLQKVSQEVSIVFHCASAISFLKPLSFMMHQNVMGINNIIELCRKLKKLDVLAYTSTAYSNSNILDEIEERVYKLPFTAEEAMNVLKNGNDEELMTLFSKCKPEFPNFYTFTKCLAETFIAERATDLPTVIVRPSIIICTIKGIWPGYVEEGTALINLSLGVGKGFIRVLPCDGHKKSNFVPADVVANTHIVGAYLQITESLPTPLVYNCVANDSTAWTWNHLIFSLLKFTLKYPLPKSFQKPSINICKSEVKYWLYSFFEHYIPAAIIDSLLWLSGHKPRLLKLYRFYDKNVEQTKYFMLNGWVFKCENFERLSDKMNVTDKELFHVDLKDLKLEDVITKVRTGAPIYQKKDDKLQGKRLTSRYLPYYLMSVIKWSVLGCIASAFYLALF